VVVSRFRRLAAQLFAYATDAALRAAHGRRRTAQALYTIGAVVCLPETHAVPRGGATLHVGDFFDDVRVTKCR
jgi:hypothetical protein